MAPAGKQQGEDVGALGRPQAALQQRAQLLQRRRRAACGWGAAAQASDAPCERSSQANPGPSCERSRKAAHIT